MLDKDFLQWIYARLEQYHGEDARVDYMRKLAAVIAATDPEQLTPNVLVDEGHK